MDHPWGPDQPLGGCDISTTSKIGTGMPGELLPDPYTARRGVPKGRFAAVRRAVRAAGPCGPGRAGPCGPGHAGPCRRGARRAPGPGRQTGAMPRHLERIVWSPRREFDPDAWPYAIPAVRQLIAEGGFEVPSGITFLVGENGSGKSTLVEAFAAVYPRRGAESSTPTPVTGPRPSDEDSPLRWHLRAQTHRLAAPGGFFLRAERM